MPGTFSPPPPVSDSDMHHGTCVTHVPWYMLGSLTRGFLWSRRRGKSFPAFPAHAQPAILLIWQEAHAISYTCNRDGASSNTWTRSISIILPSGLIDYKQCSEYYLEAVHTFTVLCNALCTNGKRWDGTSAREFGKHKNTTETHHLPFRNAYTHQIQHSPNSNVAKYALNFQRQFSQLWFNYTSGTGSRLWVPSGHTAQ